MGAVCERRIQSDWPQHSNKQIPTKIRQLHATGWCTMPLNPSLLLIIAGKNITYSGIVFCTRNRNIRMSFLILLRQHAINSGGQWYWKAEWDDIMILWWHHQMIRERCSNMPSSMHITIPYCSLFPNVNHGIAIRRSLHHCIVFFIFCPY